MLPFTVEIVALPLKLKMDAEVDPKKMNVEVDTLYFDKKGDFKIDARQQIKKQGDYSVKVCANAEKQGFEVVAKRDILSADKSNFENYFMLKDIGKYELSGIVLHRNKPNDVNVGANGHLKVTAGSNNEDIKYVYNIQSITKLILNILLIC
jgi:hypothetical protein